MKNLLAFYHQLYEDGLIDPDYLTNTWDVAPASSSTSP